MKKTKIKKEKKIKAQVIDVKESAAKNDATKTANKLSSF